MAGKTGDKMFKYKNINNYLFLFVGFLLIIASIIPKGAWSYFNDVEDIPNTLAVGVCKLDVNHEDLKFDLKNMFPDDTDSKELHILLKNSGSFFMDHLYLDTILEEEAYDGNGQNSAEKFAEQFKVEFFANGEKLTDEEWTIAKLATASPDLATWLPEKGLNVDDELDITVAVTFIEKGNGNGNNNGNGNGNPNSNSDNENDNNSQSQFEDKSLPVTFVIEGICGNGGDDDGGGSGEWDKSSLSFNGPYGSSCSQIYATVKNGAGSRDMAGPVRYEVYWAASGNPKVGTIVASGEIPALDSGESYKLTYTPTKAGVYKFKAYQRNGHPGKGELWSWSLEVSQSCFTQ